MIQVPFPPSRAALLLDFDGTLVDIAPTPESVRVPEGLAADLLRLRDMLDGALAIITGRPIAQIDHFLPDIPHAVAGEHGVMMRHAPGQALRERKLPVVPGEWVQAVEKAAADHPGASVEHKKAGMVLHYRRAPEAESAFRELASAWPVENRGFHLQDAQMAIELRPLGIDKGKALRELMAEPPFAGRLPVFAGDDVTDRDGVRAARQMGGAGWLIPDDFPDAATFRRWLHDLSEGHGWGA
ncbi:trehalose-phosphatase [Gluconobacter oxydans]|uniref:Trehalose 6-phosphate phosphatase n=1 Tax=Gluconobacter oxydans TaxID=442 RepID=A0A149RZU6_GLUOY|nr:trehalose-phosphatase [Gluconobacter oxydans]KXV20005.1 trehalose phosphatase [Gluconobacter oxydans]KXV31255.1 trehalose phosphatase [Gluconobacter oxydans]MBF0856038.1 trehalose-phosphatase [Gluconobacter oxydans]TCW27558.1 trehalose 6-phosphatase [Gluconobacter oxydans]WKE47396.1 trehalose-phosphatase [Gluconobacter oxydans]